MWDGSYKDFKIWKNKSVFPFTLSCSKACNFGIIWKIKGDLSTFSRMISDWFSDCNQKGKCELWLYLLMMFASH